MCAYLRPILLALLLTATLAGCSRSGVHAVTTDRFDTYDRVAIWTTLPREAEDLFIPQYMEAFPYQTLVERRDLDAIIGEQDLMPDRLDPETRAGSAKC